MRVIIADHHPQAQKALVSALCDQPGFTVIGKADSTDQLLELVVEQPVDMILLDYELPGISLRELIEQLRSLDHPPKVIVLSSNPENARKALAAGAAAFVSKGDEPDWLLEYLRKHANQAISDISE